MLLQTRDYLIVVIFIQISPIITYQKYQAHLVVQEIIIAVCDKSC